MEDEMLILDHGKSMITGRVTSQGGIDRESNE
jgi:hypothetical protein